MSSNGMLIVTPTPLRTRLVDDHELFREGLCVLLSKVREITVSGQAADARQGMQKAREISPELAIVDISLPGTSGLPLVKDLVRLNRKCKVLVLTMHASEVLAREAFMRGAKGFARKDQPNSEIADAVRAVARGGKYLAPGLPAEVSERRNDGANIPLKSLSGREKEIFDLAVRGFSNKAIGHELSISPKTVETHRARINRKLRVHSTAELVRYAARHGLIVSLTDT